MHLNTEKILSILHPRRAWLPISIGLIIISYLFFYDKNFTLHNLWIIRHAQWPYILGAIMAIIIRDVGYAYRIKTLTHQQLTWKKSLYVIILWEFASAVTPSVVGGTAVAIFILLRENIRLGKSIAYVMLTAIFDNLFFIFTAPLALLFLGDTIFPTISALNLPWQYSFKIIFWISYSLIALYTFIMFFALLVKPVFFKNFLIKITHTSIFRPWKRAAYGHGKDIIQASHELKGNTISYWIKMGISTLLIWSARYIILNLLIAAYTKVNLYEHVVIFGKHIMMWVMMLISPTPGSSGTAEFFFKQFYEKILGNYTIITDLLWRCLTYYLYLILGVIFLPKWLKKFKT